MFWYNGIMWSTDTDNVIVHEMCRYVKSPFDGFLSGAVFKNYTALITCTEAKSGYL